MIPKGFLAAIWDGIMQTIQDQVEADFDQYSALLGCKLFWNFKGEKYSLSTQTWLDLQDVIREKVSILCR